MPNFKFFVSVIIIALVQIAFLPNLSMPKALPNLFLILLVWSVFNSSERRGLAVGLTGGLFLDLYSGASFGANLISLVALWWLLNLAVAKIVPKDSNSYLVLIIMLISILLYPSFLVSTSLILSSHNLENLMSRYYGTYLIFQIIYSLFFYLALKKLSTKFSSRYEQKSFPN